VIACRRRRRRALQGAVVGLTVLLAPTAAPVGAEPWMAAAEQVHEIKQGDTLSGIAKRYGVTVAALVVANRLPSAEGILRIGHRLVIPRSPLTVQVTPGAALAGPPRRLAPPRPPANLVLTLPDFGDLPPIFAWPAEGHVTSTFGRRRIGWHRGVDIKAELGAPVAASAPGLVVASGLERRYGRVVKIEHVNGFVTVYAHNDRNVVDVGDRVLSGQTIALIGRTGRATAHHVHFEIRHEGVAYNPLYLLPPPPRAAVVDESGASERDDDE
jgi:murein DD-endopeptidase MepM/ murein hydrolase activator NlpD